MTDHANLVADILLRNKAVTLDSEKEISYTGGGSGKEYVDCRQIISYPVERNIITDLLVEKIYDAELLGTTCIGGPTTSAIPFAVLVANKLSLPCIYIRSADKVHGLQKRVEGFLNEDDEVLVIEDVVNTGKSSLNAIQAVKEAGGIVDACLAIFSYETEAAKKGFEESRVRLYNLCDITTLRERFHSPSMS